MILKGFEIKQRTDKHESLLDDADYEFEEIYSNGIIVGTCAVAIITESEIAEQQKQFRIVELKEIITNKNYLGDDASNERTELRVLLGL